MDQSTPKPGPAGNLEAIRDLLTRPDPPSRMMGARACLTAKNRELVPALVSALEKERELQIIVVLVQALGGYRDPRATAQLQQKLHHSAARTRANTVDSLMYLDEPVVFDAVSLLATDAASRVRASVALMIAKRDPAKVDGIARELVESDLPGLRDCAVDVLQLVGAPWCVPLLQALANRPGEEPAITARASAALDHLRQRSGPAAPAAARNSTPTPAPAPRAPAAAPPPGPPSALSAEERAAIFKAVNDSSAIVRLEALEKLATLDDKEAEERVGMAAMDADSRVRGRAEALVPEIELRRVTRQLLAKLGTASLRAGPLPSECTEFFERALALSAQLERGPRTPELVLARESALAELGRTLLGAASAGAELPEALTATCAQTQSAIANARQTAQRANEQAAASVKEKTTKGDQAAAARATRQVRALTPAPVRQTGRLQVQKPREPWAILALLSRRAVLYPVLFLLAVGGMVLYTEFKMEAQAKLIAVPQNVQPRDIGTGEYPRMMMGAPIRWEATIVEASSDKTNLTVVADGVRFLVEFEKPLDKLYDTGITVIIVGKVGSVTGRLTIRGKQVELPVRKP